MLSKLIYAKTKELRRRMWGDMVPFATFNEEEQYLLMDGVNHDDDWARMTRELEDEGVL